MAISDDLGVPLWLYMYFVHLSSFDRGIVALGRTMIDISIVGADSKYVECGAPGVMLLVTCRHVLHQCKHIADTCTTYKKGAIRD